MQKFTCGNRREKEKTHEISHVEKPKCLFIVLLANSMFTITLSGGGHPLSSLVYNYCLKLRPSAVICVCLRRWNDLRTFPNVPGFIRTRTAVCGYSSNDILICVRSASFKKIITCHHKM